MRRALSAFARDRWPNLVRVTQTQAYKTLAGLLLLACSAAALISPIVAFDDWTYHLPFAARLWGIGGADSYRIDVFLEQRWQGFPLLWEWVEGLSWFLTGSLRFTVLPQLLLCWLYFGLVSRLLSVPWYWLVMGFFASPMLLLHFQGIHVDLAAGACLALGFFLFMRQLHVGPASAATSLGTILFLGMAGNIKVQALIAAVLIVFVISAIAIAKLGCRRKTAGIIGVGAISILVSSATALSNLHQHDNPLYPFNVQVAGHPIFSGPEDPMTDANPPNYGGRAGIFVPPTPVTFILSVTELDWTLRGVAPWYTIASRTGDRPRIGEPSRTGGWGWLFVLMNGFVLLIQAVTLRSARDPMQRRLVIGTIALIVLTALIPRSHELRYWLFLPLILLPVNLRYLSRSVSPAILGGGLAVVMLYGMTQAVLTPGTELVSARLPITGPAPIPPHIVAALQKSGRYCGDDGLLFRYSTAVTGVRGMISTRREDCDT